MCLSIVTNISDLSGLRLNSQFVTPALCKMPDMVIFFSTRRPLTSLAPRVYCCRRGAKSTAITPGLVTPYTHRRSISRTRTYSLCHVTTQTTFSMEGRKDSNDNLGQRQPDTPTTPSKRGRPRSNAISEGSFTQPRKRKSAADVSMTDNNHLTPSPQHSHPQPTNVLPPPRPIPQQSP